MFRYNRIESNFKLVDQNTKNYEWIVLGWVLTFYYFIEKMSCPR